MRHLVRITEEDDREATADMERLTILTGIDWDFSMYARMCLRQYRGKHLAQGEEK